MQCDTLISSIFHISVKIKFYLELLCGARKRVSSLVNFGRLAATMAHILSNLFKTTGSRTLAVSSAVSGVDKVFAPVLAEIAVIYSSLTIGFLPLLVQCLLEKE